MDNKPIILASASPRRKQLLEGLGLSFITHSSDIDEHISPDTAAGDIVEQLAIHKAKAVASCYNNGIVIGSDTIVVLDGDILGKPNDEADAIQMLTLLQGRDHDVYTGIAVLELPSGHVTAAHQRTRVHIRSLTNEEIRDYVATGEPMDKAGAYAIQGIGSTLVTGIDGDYFTVVGLPLQRLAELLRHYGVDVLKLKQQ